MKRFTKFLSDYLTALVVIGALLVIGLFVAFGTKNSDGTVTFNGKSPIYSEEIEKAYCKTKDENDKAVADFTGTDVAQDASSGCAPTDLPQMGASVYYKVDVSTPTAFYQAVNGRGFNEGYGLQCVAAFKEFMFALSGSYVATKTGGASGYASQQAQIEPLGFKWHGGRSGLQDGDWGIFGGGQYGHVAMYYQGKWFGQNQGAANPYTGNPFNLLGMSSDSLIGYYRPNIYQGAASTPGNSSEKPNSSSSPTQNGVSSSSSYTVRQGDTLGGIALKNGWYGGTSGLYGDSGYAQQLATKNGVTWRGLIVPGQVIRR